jgi:hypothetical protein
MNIDSRLSRLDTLIAEGRLVRQEWAGHDASGRETACLLAALSPEAGVKESAGACPATVMPSWLAHLTPWIDDAGTLEHWPEVVRRYASLAHRWNVLSQESWTRLDYRVRAICVREAMRHTTDAGTLAACDTVGALCDRTAVGDTGEKDWATAGAAAAAAKSAAWSAAAAAKSAAWSAAAAAKSAAWSATAAAKSAAWSATWAAAAAAAAAAWAARAAARAAEAAAAARAARAEAAATEAADRLIDAILDAIEAACAEAEAA